MSEPHTEPAGNIQPSDPALLAVLDACEEYASLHHELLRAGRRKNVSPAAMRPLAAHLDQLSAAARQARNCLPYGKDDAP